MSDVERLQAGQDTAEGGGNPLSAVARQIGHAAANACMGNAIHRAVADIKKRNH